MKKLSNYFIAVAVIVVGLLIGQLIGAGVKGLSNTDEVKEVVVYSDTLTLENQGTVDVYQVDDAKWIVISLDDLKYVVKKRKTVVPKLESLFNRFDVPTRVPIKPVFK